MMMELVDQSDQGNILKTEQSNTQKNGKQKINKAKFGL